MTPEQQKLTEQFNALKEECESTQYGYENNCLSWVNLAQKAISETESLRAELAMALDAANKGDEARCKAGAMEDCIADLRAERDNFQDRITVLSEEKQALRAELAEARANPLSHAREKEEVQDRISWLEQQREVEVQQKEAALNESGECLKESSALRTKLLSLQSHNAKLRDALRQVEEMSMLPIESEEEADTNCRRIANDELKRVAGIVSNALVSQSDNELRDRVSGTEAEVCYDIAARQQKGIAKYGVSVADNPLALREWLQHAYEETLDNAVYLKRAISSL
jgi:chromosome segregation ATPase